MAMPVSLPNCLGGRLLDAPEQPTDLLSLLWVCLVACMAGSLSGRPSLEMEVMGNHGPRMIHTMASGPCHPLSRPALQTSSSQPPKEQATAPFVPPILRERASQTRRPPPHQQTPDTPRRRLPKLAARAMGLLKRGAQDQKRAWVFGQMLASVSSCVGQRGRGVSTLRRGWFK